LLLPKPPPADVIDEKVEGDPVSPIVGAGGVAPAAPAPIVIGYACADTGKPAGAFNGETV